MVKKAKPRKNKKKRVVRSSAPALGAAARDLLARLAERTKLSAGEVLSRAVTTYAAAVAPELAGEAPKTIGRAAPAPKKPAQRLFYSIEGGPEREAKGEVIIGRHPGSDVHLDMPLIADRHARLAFRDGRWLFEDLKSPRGSYKGGQPIQVAFLETGDEIDLGGFLPIRFRLG